MSKKAGPRFTGIFLAAFLLLSLITPAFSGTAYAAAETLTFSSINAVQVLHDGTNGNNIPGIDLSIYRTNMPDTPELGTYDSFGSVLDKAGNVVAFTATGNVTVIKGDHLFNMESIYLGSGGESTTVQFIGLKGGVTQGIAPYPTYTFDTSATIDLSENAGLKNVDEVRITVTSGNNIFGLNNIRVDVPPAYVTDVAANAANGTYKAGDQIDIEVTFNESIVISSGLTTLTLETGGNDRTATYVSGSGTSMLTFRYTVQEGDETTDLDYTFASALSGNLTHTQADPLQANLTLPPPGAAGSLGANQSIVIDAVAPTVTLSCAQGNPVYTSSVPVTISFSEPVSGFVSDDISVSGGTKSAFGGSGSTYTLTIIPNTYGTVDVTIPAGVAADAAGNSNTASATLSLTYAAKPVITTSGGTTAYTEGTPVIVDSLLTVTDADSSALSGANVSINGNFSTQDILSFVNNDAAMYGNISASYDNSSTGVLTMTSAGATATAAQWQAALRAVTFTSESENPDTATRTITFIVNDGTSDSDAATRAVSVAADNDVPTMSLPASVSVFEDTQTAITGISFVDADAGSGSVTATFSIDAGSGILTAVSGGGVTVGGTVTGLTMTGAIPDINAFIAASGLTFTPAANGTLDATMTVHMNDNGLSGGAPKTDSDTLVLDIQPVNDAPVLAVPGSVAITEDVPGALTGISISDVDAGSSDLTVTFSVPSGTLQAAGGSGVTVTGSGTGTMTLTGSAADMNSFIAAGQVTFTTAINATSNVTLTVTANDGGNAGAGGALSDSSTVTLSISAVNDAPVNAVPAAQTTLEDQDLVFNSGVGNLISIFDVDAGAGAAEVMLTATNGVMTLASTTDLAFLSGTGAGNGTMTFRGTISAINLALDGLIFTPNAGYTGPASIQIITDDMGSSGSGGSKGDVDEIAITVQPDIPLVSTVSSTNGNGTYIASQYVYITVAFTQSVLVDTTGGVPTLLLETGSVDRQAVYTSGNGSDTLIFGYQVLAGDSTADLNYVNIHALSLNGGLIQSAADNDNADLTLPAVGGPNSIAGQKAIVIDGVAALATGVALPADGAYIEGNTLNFTVTFDSAIWVDNAGGAPRIPIKIGGAARYAGYISGSGTNHLAFQYTVAAGDNGAVSVGSTIEANGSTLSKSSGMSIDPVLPGGADGNIKADTLAPTCLAVQKSGGNIALSFSEPMDTAAAGIVTVDGGAALSGPAWSNGNQTLTYTLSGTAYSHTYKLHIEGFFDAAGNAMAADDSRSFTTGAVPVYNIQATAGEGGMISPAGTITVTEGADQTFTVTPKSGYRIESVVVDGVNKGTLSSYTFGGVTATHTIYAAFAAASNPDDYISQSLTESSNGVSVWGNFTGNAQLKITQIALGEDTASQAFRTRIQDAGDKLLFSGDVSITGSYTGSIGISFTVGAAYNGQTVTLLHYKDGKVETLTAVVKDGKAVFTVTSLSPFALYAGGTQVAGPRTGDDSAPWLLLLLCGSSLAIAVLMIKNKSILQKHK